MHNNLRHQLEDIQMELLFDLGEWEIYQDRSGNSFIYHTTCSSEDSRWGTLPLPLAAWHWHEGRYRRERSSGYVLRGRFGCARCKTPCPKEHVDLFRIITGKIG